MVGLGGPASYLSSSWAGGLVEGSAGGTAFAFGFFVDEDSVVELLRFRVEEEEAAEEEEEGEAEEEEEEDAVVVAVVVAAVVVVV